MLYLYILPTSSMKKANNYIKCKWHKVPSMFQETKDPIGMCNNQNRKERYFMPAWKSNSICNMKFHCLGNHAESC